MQARKALILSPAHDLAAAPTLRRRLIAPSSSFSTASPCSRGTSPFLALTISNTTWRLYGTASVLALRHVSRRILDGSSFSSSASSGPRRSRSGRSSSQPWQPCGASCEPRPVRSCDSGPCEAHARFAREHSSPALATACPCSCTSSTRIGSSTLRSSFSISSRRASVRASACGPRFLSFQPFTQAVMK